jgi:curli biogenesis system outer membrane secretion channel CsgG
VVKPSKNSAAFERENVGGLLHDAELLALANRLGADAAKLLLGEKTTLAARVDRSGGGGDGLRKLGGPGVFVTK